MSGTPEEHAHCWHNRATTSFGGALGTYPPSPRTDVCCHCGELRTVHPEPPKVPDGHGKFYPLPMTFTLWNALP